MSSLVPPTPSPVPIYIINQSHRINSIPYTRFPRVTDYKYLFSAVQGITSLLGEGTGGGAMTPIFTIMSPNPPGGRGGWIQTEEEEVG